MDTMRNPYVGAGEDGARCSAFERRGPRPSLEQVRAAVDDATEGTHYGDLRSGTVPTTPPPDAFFH